MSSREHRLGDEAALGGAGSRDPLSRLILLRHAESMLNVEKRFCGHTDPSLSPRGDAQAKALAAQLRSEHAGAIDAVYVSPLRRARQTIAPFVDLVGVEPQVEAGLIEVDQGELDGLTFDEGMRRHPSFFEAWARDPGAATIPGGEGLLDAQRRVIAALHGIAARHAAGATLVVVGHQLAFAAALARLRGSSLAHWSRHTLRNAQWTVVLSDRQRLWCDPKCVNVGAGD